MAKTWKARWLEALRSGEYLQGKGDLCKKDRNGNARLCCLGVLAEVMGYGDDAEYEKMNKWQTYTYPMMQRYEGFSEPIVGRVTGLLPDEILDRDFQGRLADMNDSGNSFKKIANWIEKNIPDKAIKRVFTPAQVRAAYREREKARRQAEAGLYVRAKRANDEATIKASGKKGKMIVDRNKVYGRG